MITLDTLKRQFNNRFRTEQRRPGITQLFVPLYHEDGDLVDIFLETSPTDERKIRVSDHGMTLMRLSYHFEIDSEHKERILQSILSEYGLTESSGTLFADTDPDGLYATVLRFGQAVSQISSMRRYRREVVQSLFFESLQTTVYDRLKRFHPRSRVEPIPGSSEYTVDVVFNDPPKPVYLFGVNNERIAHLVTISLLKFQLENLQFTGAVVLEDLDSLSRNSQSRLMSAADKMFPTLGDFQQNGEKFLERELEPQPSSDH